jgi:hypothetical protein
VDKLAKFSTACGKKKSIPQRVGVFPRVFPKVFPKIRGVFHRLE